MNVHKQDPLAPVGGTETPESVALGRRRWLKAFGLTAGAGVLGLGAWQAWRKFRGSDEEVVERGRVAEIADSFAVPARDARFEYGRPETVASDAARFTNFFEFSQQKSIWRYVDRFRASPWTIEITGLCRQPLSLDFEEFERRFASFRTERQYRHRCVETWAMAVPWIGVPLVKVLEAVDPLASATHVKFTTFHRPSEADGFADMPDAPWPYTEGLTAAEAQNELPLLVTGMYGRPLLKQHGAPIRLVVPWKYGYKSIKSIEKIELVDRQPATFWNTLYPEWYPFESNVDPDVITRWPQQQERMLGTVEPYPTQIYNGYGEYVARLYG